MHDATMKTITFIFT